MKLQGFLKKKNLQINEFCENCEKILGRLRGKCRKIYEVCVLQSLGKIRGNLRKF